MPAIIYHLLDTTLTLFKNAVLLGIFDLISTFKNRGNSLFTLHVMYPTPRYCIILWNFWLIACNGINILPLTPTYIRVWSISYCFLSQNSHWCACNYEKHQQLKSCKWIEHLALHNSWKLTFDWQEVTKTFNDYTFSPDI